jgi:alpha-L-fucosidase
VGIAPNDDFTYVSTAWVNDWMAQGAELVEKYHSDVVYFDWWIGVINYKDYAMLC